MYCIVVWSNKYVPSFLPSFVINVFHILSGWNCLRKRKLLSRDRSAHTAKRMCPTEHCTTGETPRARTSAKVVISCSTFSNADHCYYKLIKGDLPKYFQHFSYIHNFEIHHHYTRETSSIFIPRVNHAYAQKHIRHNLIQTINNTPNNIIDKIHTHSLRGFLNYIKVFIFGNYEDHCHVSNCYMQTLKYMLKIILLPDYYTINFFLMLCNNFILFVFI